MIYIVTGVMRSGTSMVMHALKEGGMDVYWNPEHEALLDEKHTRNQNRNGWYEPGDEDFERSDFPLFAEGQAIKILNPWQTVLKVPVHEYKILVMLRDPREISVSTQRLYNGVIFNEQWQYLKKYYNVMQSTVSLLANRRDVSSVTVADYCDAVQNPSELFGILEEEGWPIDAKKAAATINPSEYKPKFDTPFSGDLEADMKVMWADAKVEDDKIIVTPKEVA